ncbi:O-antigen ligase family protein [Candidatus Pelagibacter sp. RS40]|uniref:O-antigen ligase family protein n=1 Tax=Candidatus Pelagibacter sp. RS40 TaxID=1977865 RepID=UPI000A148603|nr:O-antigen ligase family protein [Candidatus Pelagibacter sp. RS40]ARJ49246.1 hypothetical protein B8063_04305 [Candidatus Pelagibacter sp. RS40]
MFSLKLFKINIFSFLCALIVPFLVLGPFIPDLIISFLSLLFLYHTCSNNQYKVYNNPFFFAFLTFWFICVISSLFSDNVFISLKSSFFFIRIAIFALLISYLIETDKKILTYFYYIFLITYTILVIDGFTQYHTGVNLIGYPVDGIRVSSFFKDELILGSFLTRLFPLFFALFMIKKKNNFELCYVFLLLVFVDILVFLSAERTAFVLFNLSTLFIILFVSKYKFLRLCALIISFCFITFIASTNKQIYERYITNPIQEMGLQNEVAKKYIFSPSHDFLIRTSWNMFLDKPIFGHGPKMFRFQCKDAKYKADPKMSCENHPHNFYMQLLAETGILGFSFLLGLFIYCIYIMLKHLFYLFKFKKRFLSDYQICLLAGLFITIWPISASGNIFNNNLMMLYGLQIGFFKKK